MSVNLIKHKLLVVVLVLLAFVGQAVASTTVPCHDMKSMDMSEKMMMSHSMDSSPMASDAHNSENMVAADCCQQDCNCPMGLSLSATLPNSAFIDGRVISSQRIEQYTTLMLNDSLTSLYRPPIA
ncbi:MAG: hypothetical protein ACI93V_001170 [Alteromonadaceae bacterium]